MPKDNLDSSLPKRIQSLVDERTEEIDPVRLNKAQFLDPCLRLTPPQRAVIDTLLRKLDSSQKIFRKSRTETFEILCANLFYATNPLIVPMDTHYWIGDGRQLASTIIKDVVIVHRG